MTIKDSPRQVRFLICLQQKKELAVCTAAENYRCVQRKMLWTPVVVR